MILSPVPSAADADVETETAAAAASAAASAAAPAAMRRAGGCAGVIGGVSEGIVDGFIGHLARSTRAGGHAPQPHAGQREHRVGHGGRDRRQAGLADAGGVAVIVEDLHDDLRASNIRSDGNVS